MGQKGLKTTYKIGTDKVGNLTNISGIEPTKDTSDITTLDDDWRKFRGGLKDGGEVSLEGFYTKADVGQVALKTAFDSDDETSQHIITFPNNATWTFSGVVTNHKIGDANLDDNITFSATIKVSGEPVFAEAI